MKGSQAIQVEKKKKMKAYVTIIYPKGRNWENRALGLEVIVTLVRHQL